MTLLIVLAEIWVESWVGSRDVADIQRTHAKAGLAAAVSPGERQRTHRESVLSNEVEKGCFCLAIENRCISIHPKSPEPLGAWSRYSHNLNTALRATYLYNHLWQYLIPYLSNYAASPLTMSLLINLMFEMDLLLAFSRMFKFSIMVIAKVISRLEKRVKESCYDPA